MEPESTYGLSDDQLGDLARLADGTLPADRRAEVEARVAASPELASLVERQRVALDALRGTADTRAPARLRAHVERRQTARPVALGGRRRIILGAVGLAAAAALAVALVLPFSGGPNVAEAAALAQRPPTQAAPGQVPGVPQLLRARVDGVSFPDYAAKFGWRPVGARRDDLSGRTATTVYYRKGDRTIAYTIVSGDTLGRPPHARSTTRAGVEFRTLRDDGRAVVTWERGGHTCVLSGEAVASTELVTLADWRGMGAVSF